MFSKVKKLSDDVIKSIQNDTKKFIHKLRGMDNEQLIMYSLAELIEGNGYHGIHRDELRRRAKLKGDRG